MNTRKNSNVPARLMSGDVIQIQLTGRQYLRVIRDGKPMRFRQDSLGNTRRKHSVTLVASAHHSSVITPAEARRIVSILTELAGKEIGEAEARVDGRMMMFVVR